MSFLVVGLGNPGRKYERTRHNLGFMVADSLAKDIGAGFIEKDTYMLAEGIMNSDPLFILKPLTFMNLSGRAVSSFLRYRSDSGAGRMIVAYDDLDLPVGALRLRKNGSGGGHKGVRSIIQETGSREFYHLRIGIDKPPLKELVDDYVLGRFSPGERSVIEESVKDSVTCIQCFITEGAATAMNRFNAAR